MIDDIYTTGSTLDEAARVLKRQGAENVYFDGKYWTKESDICYTESNAYTNKTYEGDKMLNESKVKLDDKDGDVLKANREREDFKISSYYKKDYRSFHTIATIIWVTVGYAVAVGIGVIAFLDELMKNLNMQFLVMLAAAVIIGYLVLVIFMESLLPIFTEPNMKSKKACETIQSRSYKTEQNV